jgi:hypothetical protein
MIPSTKNQLLVAENWKKIYQSYRNADFQSYDFETLRRTMINYLQETYPEEFNDYIDSSEYIALVDLIAFLGQNLSFRIDLNARENFLETAQRKDSVLRLAQLISYNPKRNTPANGLLKITALRTTENVFDVNGLNLANQVIVWNDSTNVNWYQQFLSVLNSAMPDSAVFGNPADSAILNGISTEQYKINSYLSDLPIFGMTKSVNGSSMNFEITGASFSGQNYIYEQPPQPGVNFSYIFQNDNQGSGSSNTGFFVNFKQGAISSTEFSFTDPVANEIVAVNANGINNQDVWLWQIGYDGSYQTLWERADALVGNNVIYNNLDKSLRSIYTVSSRTNDQIDLNFSDGKFGDLPKGNFVLYYRQSNGKSYTITPDQMSGINITIPYISKNGSINQLTLILSLQYAVTNSSPSETIDSIKAKAPQTYYTQNRMITAEDYNIAPLAVGNNILKVKSVNRISSGISKYYELSDVSGKYSSTDIFSQDGILYKDYNLATFEFEYFSRNQIFAAIKTQLAPYMLSGSFKNFYYEQYPRPDLTSTFLNWTTVTTTNGQTTGYIKNKFDMTPVQTGYFSSNNTVYVTPGALIKFDVTPNSTPTYVWSKVIQVVGDGANSGKGALNDGTGPVILSGKIPNDSELIEIIPAFVDNLSYAMETQMVNLCMAQRNFGLTFDKVTRQWNIVIDSNLDLVSEFSLTYQNDTTNTQKDASWMISFEWTGTRYKVSVRLLEYVFESAKQTAFFVDYNNVNYDFVTNTVIKDRIDVLSINPKPDNSGLGLSVDYRWQIDSPVIESDGFIEPKKVIVSFYDANNDGQIDTPDAFSSIVGTNESFVYFQVLNSGNRYQLLEDQTLITAYPNETSVVTSSSDDGKLFYFYETDVVKTYSHASNLFTLNTQYFAKNGRPNLKFHYMHNSGESRRIDPSKTNIIDIYVLTSGYDAAYRNFLMSQSTTAPMAPTSQSLENEFAADLEPIKSISDTLVYHPAKYKVLFGSQAVSNLQATFKAVRNPARITSDNDLKTRILEAINSFFSLDNWDFGQTFNFTELSTYVLNQLTPDVLNFIIVPKNTSMPFGSLFEITCQANEILISGTTTNDIEIIDSVTNSQINSSSPIITNTNVRS